MANRLSSHFCESEVELRSACRLLKRAVECLCFGRVLIALVLFLYWSKPEERFFFFFSSSCLVTASLITLFLSDSRERVDQMLREKEKLRSDLDKAEKLKSLMASEVDDHHAAIERRNEYNLRCDGWGQGPPLPPPWPRTVGFACLPACLATPGWGDLGVARPTRKQGSLDTFSGSFPSL